jgi:hypothetical protein
VLACRTVGLRFACFCCIKLSTIFEANRNRRTFTIASVTMRTISHSLIAGVEARSEWVGTGECSLTQGRVASTSQKHTCIANTAQLSKVTMGEFLCGPKSGAAPLSDLEGWGLRRRVATTLLAGAARAVTQSWSAEQSPQIARHRLLTG